MFLCPGPSIEQFAILCSENYQLYKQYLLTLEHWKSTPHCTGQGFNKAFSYQLLLRNLIKRESFIPAQVSKNLINEIRYIISQTDQVRYIFHI